MCPGEEHEVEIEPPAEAAGVNEIVHLQGGSTVVDGRETRKYKNSNRPPYLWPETWQMMSNVKKAEEIKKYNNQLWDDVWKDPKVINAIVDLEINQLF